MYFVCSGLLWNQREEDPSQMPTEEQLPPFSLSSRVPLEVGTLSLQELNFDEALTRAGFGRYQYTVVATLALAYFAEIAEESISFIIGPELLCQWHLEGWQEALTTTAPFIGMFFGALVWGKLSDVWGRKPILIAICIWTGYYGIISAFAPSVGWYFTLRVLCGFGIGGIHTVPTYAAELVETKQRAKCMLILHVLSGLAPLFTGVAAFLLIDISKYGWRFLVVICSIPQFVCLVVSYLVLDESPRYLLVSGQTSRAKWILTKIAAINRADLLFGDVTPIAKPTRGNYAHLFASKQMTRLTICQCILWFCTLGTGFGMGILFTESLQAAQSNTDPDGKTCFSSDEVIYCKASCHVLDSSDYAKILISHVHIIIGAFISMSLSNYVGRVRLMLCCMALYCFFTMPLFFCPHPVLALILITLCKVCIVATIQAMYLYLCEAYPTNVRATAIGLGTSCSRIGMILTPFVAQVLAKSNFILALSVYMFVGIVTMIAIMVLPFDTTGKTIKDR